MSENQLKALRIFNQLKEELEKDNAIISTVSIGFVGYSKIAELNIGCKNLRQLKTLLANLGLTIRKIEKFQYPTGGQYAEAEDKENDIHLHVYPSGDNTFEGCKIVEETIAVAIPEHVIPAQPAREAIPEHIEPQHIEYQTRKVLKCHNE